MIPANCQKTTPSLVTRRIRCNRPTPAQRKQRCNQRPTPRQPHNRRHRSRSALTRTLVSRGQLLPMKKRREKNTPSSPMSLRPVPEVMTPQAPTLKKRRLLQMLGPGLLRHSLRAPKQQEEPTGLPAAVMLRPPRQIKRYRSPPPRAALSTST